MEWSEILKTLIGYGVTGVITFVFIKDKITNSDKQLKLIEQITARMEAMTTAINEVRQDVNGLDKSVKASALQTLEVLYDEKTLNTSAFLHNADILNSKYIYKALSQVMGDIDENGFNKCDKLNMLKDNIVDILQKSKDDFSKEVLGMAYSSDKLCDFEGKYSILFLAFIEELKSDILTPTTYDDIKDDKNYAVFKNRIRIKIWELSRNTTGLLKNISKSY